MYAHLLYSPSILMYLSANIEGPVAAYHLMKWSPLIQLTVTSHRKLYYLLIKVVKVLELDYIPQPGGRRIMATPVTHNGVLVQEAAATADNSLFNCPLL